MVFNTSYSEYLIFLYFKDESYFLVKLASLMLTVLTMIQDSRDNVGSLTLLLASMYEYCNVFFGHIQYG